MNLINKLLDSRGPLCIGNFIIWLVPDYWTWPEFSKERFGSHNCYGFDIGPVQIDYWKYGKPKTNE